MGFIPKAFINRATFAWWFPEPRMLDGSIKSPTFTLRLDKRGWLDHLWSDHRTEDSLFIINTVFDSYVIHQNKPLYIAFVDFSKFFDKINRTHLLYKLLKCGITGRVYDIVKSMYKDTGYRVHVNNHLSPRFTGSLGIKQGCCLSPTLSNIFQNDLHVLFKDSACDPVKLGTKYLNSLSWADDLFLVSTTRDGLQKCLDKLRSYCIKWGLEVNSDKTKTMIFSKQKRTMGQLIKYGESNLENVDSFEYFWFKLKYNTAVSHLMADRASKAWRVTHMVMQAISTNDKNISPRLSLNLFDKQIMPILNYGAAVCSVPRTYNLIYLHNQTGKNTRQLVSKLFDDICGIKIPFVYAKRVGKITEGDTVDQRKILIKLVSYSQKELLLRDYSHIFSIYEDKNRSKKCTNIFVKER